MTKVSGMSGITEYPYTEHVKGRDKVNLHRRNGVTGNDRAALSRAIAPASSLDADPTSVT